MTLAQGLAPAKRGAARHWSLRQGELPQQKENCRQQSVPWDSEAGQAVPLQSDPTHCCVCACRGRGEGHHITEEGLHGSASLLA